jgi:hypothetical protein
VLIRQTASIPVYIVIRAVRVVAIAGVGAPVGINHIAAIRVL